MKRPIRFATTLVGQDSPVSLQPLQPRQIKDRTGCYPCKRRRVKCDEALPSCTRCVKRKEHCHRPLATQSGRHMLVLPREPQSISACRGVRIDGVNWSLLDYWFNHVCRILCNYPPATDNPFSSRLLETLVESPAAMHTFQSLSAGFQTSFNVVDSSKGLEERGSALSALRLELEGPNAFHERTLLTIVVLGLSATWMSDDPSDLGLQHLQAANAVLERLLSDNEAQAERSDMFYTAVAMLIYWDMACSFLAPLPTRSTALYDIAKRIDSFSTPHPVVGFSNELCLILGSIGRLCRKAQDAGERNIRLEIELRARLIAWSAPTSAAQHGHAMAMAISLRETGFILLSTLQPMEERETYVSEHVRSLMDALDEIPTSSPYFGSQALVLALGSSEFTGCHDRALAEHRFRELYRHNRLKVNLQALDLCKEVWERRDQGQYVGILEVMESNGWPLMLG